MFHLIISDFNFYCVFCFEIPSGSITIIQLKTCFKFAFVSFECYSWFVFTNNIVFNFVTFVTSTEFSCWHFFFFFVRHILIVFSLIRKLYISSCSFLVNGENPPSPDSSSNIIRLSIIFSFFVFSLLIAITVHVSGFSSVMTNFPFSLE